MVQRELVELARNGDREAFSALAASVVDRLYATAVLILRDHSLADDATQEAIVRAWRDLPPLRDPDRFDAWLRRLLVNACRDEGRRQRRRRPEMTLLPTNEPTVDDSSAAIADRDALERGFRRLSSDHRTAVVLHHYSGFRCPSLLTRPTFRWGRPSRVSITQPVHFERRLRPMPAALT